jgi:UDP-glucose 4-epimerase
MEKDSRYRVLITGVAGFIGSNLAKRLLREGRYDVVGIDNLSYGRKERIPPGVEFHKADIREDITWLFNDVDYVFHLAAKNCLSDCQDDPAETADINIRGTANVFSACVLARVKKVIYAESSAVYEGVDRFPTPESEGSPRSFYSISKHCTMFFAEAYARYYEMRYTALRYFNVYGEDQDYHRTLPPVCSAFIIKLIKGERPVIYGDGSKRRDFIYVDDVNDFHVLCMHDERATGGTFNLGSGVSYSIREIYDIIRRLMGSETEPIYQDSSAWEADVTLADITRACDLGWKPKTPIEDGLTASINFLKKEISW